MCILVRRRAGEKPFNCAYKPRSLVRQSALKPTTNQLFNCEVCHKRFSTKMTMNEHVQTHTAEKLFNCKQCNKKFSNKSNLNVHTTTHTGKKNFLMRYAAKVFSKI